MNFFGYFIQYVLLALNSCKVGKSKTTFYNSLGEGKLNLKGRYGNLTRRASPTVLGDCLVHKVVCLRSNDMEGNVHAVLDARK